MFLLVGMRDNFVFYKLDIIDLLFCNSSWKSVLSMAVHSMHVLSPYFMFWHERDSPFL